MHVGAESRPLFRRVFDCFLDRLFGQVKTARGKDTQRRRIAAARERREKFSRLRPPERFIQLRSPGDERCAMSRTRPSRRWPFAAGTTAAK